MRIPIEDYESMTEAVRLCADNGFYFKDLRVSKCFKLASLLINEIQEAVPELKEDQTFHVQPLVTGHQDIARQVYLLERVVASVNHSNHYMKFLDNSRMLTVEMIANDRDMMDALYSCEELSEADWELYVRKAHQHQVEASQIVVSNVCSWTDIEFQETPIYWFEKPKTKSGDGISVSIMRGGFYSNIVENIREIELNTHPDAGLKNIFSAISVVHHETIHDQGFQLGRLCYEGNEEQTGELFHDGDIWKAVGEFKAIVPCGISDAYKAQCIEKVAFAQQALFDKAIQDLVSVPLLKVACSTPNNP